MGDFPVHQMTPRLLPNPAASPSAENQLEGGQVRGLVVQLDEAARLEQFHHIGSFGTGREGGATGVLRKREWC